MPVILRQSSELPRSELYQTWFAVTGTKPRLDPADKLPRLAERLEAAFVACRDIWWRVGREMAGEATADIAHAPTGGAFGSDFGVMLSWAHMVNEEAAKEQTTLVVCDDPWLFRHLATIAGVDAGHPPALFMPSMRLAIRGWLARIKVAFSMALAALRMRKMRRVLTPGDTVILVYGHPASNAEGFDAYFGDLMKTFANLKRLLHTDCPPGPAMRLIADGRTASLHGWGCPGFALSLVFARWRPGSAIIGGEYGWLVRRAAARENGGGGPAMNRWQMHCQDHWLKNSTPGRVVWPWENHGWERNLCRSARRLGVPSLGYQHTVIGPHQINYATATNPDGLASIPDMVIADGPAYRDEMAAWGVPGDRLIIGGALRFSRFKANLFDPKGPVFVPLSAVPAAAEAQLSAARLIAERGARTVVKNHPMYPVAVGNGENMEITDIPLAEQKGVSAVLYSTGTSGLEAMLMGVPAFRLMLEDRIAINVLPDGAETCAVTLDDVVEKITAGNTPNRLDWDVVLGDPDIKLWKKLLFGDIHSR